jgi:hypothetical protein
MYAFNVLDKNSTSPVGYQRIPCHMIFDIKMDFTHFVVGGHVTDPPTSIIYSSVVSRESARIAFLVAALNGLDIMAADIGNAYLNAYTSERVYTITGPGFGEDAGRIADIVRAFMDSSRVAQHSMHSLLSPSQIWISSPANLTLFSGDEDH